MGGGWCLDLCLAGSMEGGVKWWCEKCISGGWFYRGWGNECCGWLLLMSAMGGEDRGGFHEMVFYYGFEV